MLKQLRQHRSNTQISIHKNKTFFLVSLLFVIFLIFLIFLWVFTVHFSLYPPRFVLGANQQKTVFTLTEEEEAYLQTLRTRPLVIAYSYDLVHKANTEATDTPGMLDPILDILQNEFGLTVELVKTNWQEAFVQIENQTADFYGPIAISENRRQKYITVDPFYRSYSKIITRVNDPVHSMVGLHNRSIGLLEGSVISRTMQAYLGPEGQTIYFPSMEAMINGLKTGQIDAFATVDNAELEIFPHDDIQFEFSIDNFYVDQGFISGREDVRPLAMLLNRYLRMYPHVSDDIVTVRRQGLLSYMRSLHADAITALQAQYTEIPMYADKMMFPLCYTENGVLKGMQLEINDIFETLTGVGIRLDAKPDRKAQYPNGVASVMEQLKTGECMAMVGAGLDIDTWYDPAFTYSPLLWMETIRTYTNKDLRGQLQGKTMGAMRFTSDYLGWNNTTGNAPILYYSFEALLDALKQGDVDIIFMGEMRFNYNYTVRGDYSLREAGGITAEVPIHMLYGAQNHAFNALYDEAIRLFHVLNPQSLGQWKTESDRYKTDYMRMRYIQQIATTVLIIVFGMMMTGLMSQFARNKQAHKRTRDALADVEEKRQTILDSIRYASKIQRNLLPVPQAFKKAFADSAVIWRPRDVVGGDIYWLKNFSGGTVLCVCDCTGHGTPGALLSMLVVSALEASVKTSNCHDPADIIWQLEQRLVTVFSIKPDATPPDPHSDLLPDPHSDLHPAPPPDSGIKDGCDLAVLFIAKDKSVTLAAANLNVFVCDGVVVQRMRGQKLFIGEGLLSHKDAVKTIRVPADANNKFYIASDGLFSQPGERNTAPFGYKRFGELLLQHHTEAQSVITDRIWEAWQAYRGSEQRVDDFELITFKP